MASAASVSTASDLAPTTHPIETFTKDVIISWFRGEFAAANAIIDALCGHLSRLEGGRCEYESVFAAIHRRRINWIPILQMQKYFSIADVTLELQKVTETKSKGVQKIEEEVDVSLPLKVQHHEIPKEDPNDRNRNRGVEAVDDDFTRLNSPTNEIKITDPGNNDYTCYCWYRHDNKLCVSSDLSYYIHTVFYQTAFTSCHFSRFFSPFLIIFYMFYYIDVKFQCST